MAKTIFYLILPFHMKILLLTHTYLQKVVPFAPSPVYKYWGIIESDLPENTCVKELSRNLAHPDFDLIPWPPPQSMPSRHRNLLTRRPSESLGSDLIADHVLATFKSTPVSLILLL
jgi:hypothetical protein